MPKPTQDELLEIFEAVKKQIVPYEKASLVAHVDIPGKYDLWGTKKDLVIAGKLRPQMNLVTIIVQSSYVGFYYMPIYTNCEEVTKQLSPALLKTLKGKACFHIKTVDKDMLKDIKQAMKTGYDVYSKNGWV